MLPPLRTRNRYPLRQKIKDVIDELSDGTEEFISHTSQIWDGRAGEYVRIGIFY